MVRECSISLEGTADWNAAHYALEEPSNSNPQVPVFEGDFINTELSVSQDL